MSEHTPGPWLVAECKYFHATDVTVRDTDGWLIAAVTGANLSNAHLIAAAPDFRLATESVIEAYDGLVEELGWGPWCAGLQDTVDGLRDALAKAQGECRP